MLKYWVTLSSKYIRIRFDYILNHCLSWYCPGDKWDQLGGELSQVSPRLL